MAERTPTANAFVACPVVERMSGYVEGRWQFLVALRQPVGLRFWQSLNQAWRSRDQQELDDLFARYKIKPNDWFWVALTRTVAEWGKDPEGPSARLDPGDLWFYYHEPDLPFPMFDPKFSEA